MADAPNTVSTLAGYYKKVYAEKLDNVIPASSLIYDLVELEEAKRTGDSYNFPVLLTLENGFTVNGASGSVVTLNDTVAAVSKEASIQGVELIGRAQMAYTAASRAAAEGPAAFGRAWGQALQNLRVSHMKRLELMLLYGQLGLGVVESLTSETILVTEASWSPATWIGLEGALFEFWTGTSTSETEHGTTTGSTLASIVNSARQLVFATSGPSGGTPATANDVIYFYGARTTTAFNECVGLMKIAQNTSGSMFGISATTYGIWAGNLKSSFGSLTMGKLLDAISDAVDRGLDEKVILAVCPKAYEVLNADLSANRHFDGSYSREKLENGTQSIVFNGQMGQVEIRVHPFLRRGEAVAFPVSQMKLIGSADVGMGIPGTDGREVFFHMTTKNAVEARSFSDLALLCLSPARTVAITGISYS